MTNETIFSVNTVVPGEDVVQIDYFSNHTLLDADIVLFTPESSIRFCDEFYQGQPCLSQQRSIVALEQKRHWKNEIVTAVNAGKLIIIYLEEPKTCFRYTGEKEVSGTGRYKNVTNIVTKMNSYDTLPNLHYYSAKTGKNTKLTKGGSFIAPYWREFSEYSPYCAEVTGDFSETVRESEVGGRVVGAIKRSNNGGAILFLPPVDFFREEFHAEDDEGEGIWTDAGLQLGKRFVASISSLADGISENKNIEPPPNWVLDDKYRLSRERYLENEIIQIGEKLARLEDKKTKFQRHLQAESSPRHLLYEKGKPLEAAIIESLIVMGFEADNFDDGESEFDAIFSTPDGTRLVGEAEGRDSKAIDIGTFSQLERNIHEDFSRDEVGKLAKGVLFGNGFRLSMPTERAGVFTRKCLMAARRTGYALVRTQDMFEPIKYLKKHPDDGAYGEACRRAIAHTEGDIVKFPIPPTEKLVEQENRSIDGKESTQDGTLETIREKGPRRTTEPC